MCRLGMWRRASATLERLPVSAHATGLIAALLLCSIAAARSEDGCTPGSEFEPRTCPLELPRITRIAVLRNAAKSTQQSDLAVSCKAFRLSPKRVHHYLTHAKTVAPNESHHTLDVSPCFASGEVSFADGRRGRWHIEQLRAGRLKIGDADEQTLYCPSCKLRPFQW
jgi:hypothetical protein